ncbi:unnamed protein product [Mytilus coruscus]|uniref:Uncharacterized protein n=1 Tax=Mytilus coruscus TaxID=42192 RepID=A0A6J8EKC6_MYTCO|nr:unnamed protein product [Mytilus coruscus]
MPESKCILIIDIDSLISIHSVTTENSYFAVNSFSNLLTVGGDQTLEIISEDGKVNRTFPVPGKSSSSLRCIRKRSDDSLLFTNFYDLYCIRLIDGTNLFKYSSTIEARGIAEDKYGCLYIADKVQKNIHRIAPDGSFIGFVGQKEDVHEYPIALRFNSDYSKLYVGLSRSDKMLVFQCK